MSTNHHTVIGTGAAANASVFNSPLSQLDTAITTNATSITGLSSTVTTLQNSIILGGAAVTLTNGAANAAQKVVTVDSSAQFVAGCYVEYTLVGGVVERNVVDTVDSGTQITLITNIGTGGIADNSPVAVIPVGFYNALAGIYNVRDYGAVGDGSTDDTTAVQAALSAAGASVSGVVTLPAGTYKITSSLALVDDNAIVGSGTASILQFTPSASNDVLFEATEKNRITFSNFKITATNNKTDSAFLLTNVNEVTFEDLYIDGTYTGFDVAAIHLAADTGAGANNTANIRISRCWIGACVGDGIKLDGDSGSHFWLHHSRITNNSGYGVWAYMAANWNIITLDTSILEGNYLGNVLLANATATRIIGCYLENAADNATPPIVFDGSSCQSIVIEGCNIGAVTADPLIYHMDTIAGGLNYLRNVRISNNRITGGAGNKVFKSLGVILGGLLAHNFLVSFGSDDIRTLIDVNFCSNVVINDEFGLYHFSEPTEGDITYPIIHFATDALRLEYPQTPASAAATGNAGEICWDANYIYVCTATDTWKRAAIATWP